MKVPTVGFDWQKFGVWIGGRLREVVAHGSTLELCLRSLCLQVS